MHVNQVCHDLLPLIETAVGISAEGGVLAGRAFIWLEDEPENRPEEEDFQGQ